MHMVAARRELLWLGLQFSICFNTTRMMSSTLVRAIVRMGDALLGQFARAFVLLLGFLAPTMSKNISWDYNSEDVGPIVPEWGGPTAYEKRSSRQAEFA